MQIGKLFDQGIAIARKLCMPSFVYLILSGLTLLGMVLTLTFVFDPVDFLGKVVWTGLWTYVLDLICKRGYEGLSWLLVFLPFIIGILVLFGVGGAAFLAYEDNKKGREGLLTAWSGMHGSGGPQYREKDLHRVVRKDPGYGLEWKQWQGRHGQEKKPWL